MALDPDQPRPARPLITARATYALIFAFGLLLVPLEVWHEWTGRQARIAEVQVAASNLARSVVGDAESQFSRADTALVGLVEQIENEGTGPAALIQAGRLMRRQLDNQPDLRNFTVYGPEGGLLLSSYAPIPVGTGISDREYFRHHRDDPSREGWLGSAVRSRLDGQWVITLSRRFRNAQGGFGGVIVAAMEVGALTRTLGGYDMGRHGSIALVRSDGRLLSRVPLDEGALGAPIIGRTPVRDSVAQRGSGPFRFVSPVDGVDRLGAFASGERYPVSVLVGSGTQEALADWTWRALLRLLVVIVFSTLIVILGDRLMRNAQRRREAERTLAESEAQFRLLAEHASDMVSRIGPDGLIRYASPAAERLLGLPAPALMGRPLEEFTDPEDRAALRAALEEASGSRQPASVTGRIARPNGASGWMETTVQRIRAGEADPGDGFVAVSRDVTERRIMEQRLAELASTDGLTGLCNRRRFDEILALEWRRSARDATWLAVLLLDVDRFKMFNDRQGHLAGDDALRAVAQAVNAAIRRPADSAARYGGEEFAVILPGTDIAGACDVAQRVRAALRHAGVPHDANESGLVTASIGVAALRPVGGAAPDLAGLIGAADGALYEAKRTGRDRVVAAPEITPAPARTASRAGE